MKISEKRFGRYKESSLKRHAELHSQIEEMHQRPRWSSRTHALNPTLTLSLDSQILYAFKITYSGTCINRHCSNPNWTNLMSIACIICDCALPYSNVLLARP